MNEDIIESFIKARKDGSHVVKIMAIALVAVVLDAVILALAGLMGILLVIMISGIGIMLSMIIVRRSRLEYEISIVTGEMTISEIRNQAWRKKILSFDLKEAEGFKKAKPEEAEYRKKLSKENNHRILCCFGNDDEDIYFFVARAKEEGVVYEIFIAPDSRVKKEMAYRNSDAKRTLA